MASYFLGYFGRCSINTKITNEKRKKQNKTKSLKMIKIKKDWHRQTPHYTYVTRARTTRPPPSPTTATATMETTTTEVWTTTTSPVSDDVVDEDEEDDYRPSHPESRTIASNWPDRIDPIPTFWPTQNWWGTIDPMRQDPRGGGSGRSGGQQSRQSNRIPTYAPPPSSRPFNQRNRGGDEANPVARSSSSRPTPPPYFQLLLAGLAQVRWLMRWSTSSQPCLPWLLGRLFRHRPLLATVSVIVAAASLFQILA